jgi:hypothetical protein
MATTNAKPNSETKNLNGTSSLLNSGDTTPVINFPAINHTDAFGLFGPPLIDISRKTDKVTANSDALSAPDVVIRKKEKLKTPVITNNSIVGNNSGGTLPTILTNTNSNATNGIDVHDLFSSPQPISLSIKSKLKVTDLPNSDSTKGDIKTNQSGKYTDSVKKLRNVSKQESSRIEEVNDLFDLFSSSIHLEPR